MEMGQGALQRVEPVSKVRGKWQKNSEMLICVSDNIYAAIPPFFAQPVYLRFFFRQNP